MNYITKWLVDMSDINLRWDNSNVPESYHNNCVGGVNVYVKVWFYSHGPHFVSHRNVVDDRYSMSKRTHTPYY